MPIALARRMVFAFEHFNLDEMLRLCSPDVELVTLYEQILGRPLRGHDDLELWFAFLRRTFAFIETHTEVLENHGEWVIAGGAGRARGRRSNEIIQLPWYAAMHFEDERCDRLEINLSYEDALAVVRGSRSRMP